MLAPQLSLLVKVLTNHGSISSSEAQDLRIRALPRRISDLRELGYSIRREIRKDVCGQRYARYFLIA